MKKFKYRADKLLRVYEIDRDKEKKKLVSMQKEVAKMKQKINENNTKIKNAFEQISSDKISIEEKKEMPNHINFLKMKNQGLEDQLKEALKSHQIQMKTLLEAQKKVKSLEQHKEKKSSEYKKEVSKKEERTLSDLNSRKRKLNP